MVGMQRTFCIYLDSNSHLDQAWHCLEGNGFQVLYCTESPDGEKEIFVEKENGLNVDDVKALLPEVLKVEPVSIQGVDWSAQWEAHGLDFRDGYVHVDLGAFSPSLAGQDPLLLEPGPGFGDLSHPTTRMVINMMVQRCCDRDVFDVGCGSAVLSLVAIAAGAKKVIGVDIDKAIVEHAKKNAALNRMQDRTQFSFPSELCIKDLSGPYLIVMNMIWSEQMVAWESLKELHGIRGDLIVSGIRLEEGQNYLKWAEEMGWRLCEQCSEELWCVFRFSYPSDC